MGSFSLVKKKVKAPIYQTSEYGDQNKSLLSFSFATVLMRNLVKVPIVVSVLLLIYLWSLSLSTISGTIPVSLLENATVNSSSFSPVVTLDVEKENPSPVFEDVRTRRDVKKEIQSLDINNGAIISSVEINDSKLIIPILENATIVSDVGDERDPVVTMVKDYMRVLRSWASKKKRDTCEGRGIFVYDLPSKFNKDFGVRHCDVMALFDLDCKDFTNNGLGKPIPELGPAWFNTHQFILEPIFHTRVLKHPCMVHNVDEAKLFYVPFYGGLDILRWHFRNVSNDVKDALGLDLIKWLQRQKTWTKNAGKDHVFVLGTISWNLRRQENFTWGTRFLELDQMQNPAKILIERQPWHKGDIGVPYPTFFHPQSDMDIAMWQNKIISSERKSLVGFAGAARPNIRVSIRSILIDQCKSVDSSHCRFLNCAHGGCKRPEWVTQLFMESEFCLQPPGDSPTRKSMFDSLVAGCIPVLFDPFTAYYQYPWHLPEDHGKYSVFVDQKEVREMKVNVVERLSKVSKRERDDMRRFIVYELLPGLIYGGEDAQFDRFQDAFSITINSLFERVNALGLSQTDN